MLRAEYLLSGMVLCGYDAVTLGEQDFRFGETFLSQHLSSTELTFTSANLTRGDSKYVSSFYQTELDNGLTVGVIGVVDEEMNAEVEEASSIAGSTVTIEPAADEISAAMAELGEVGLVVVLAHMPAARAAVLAKELSGVGIVIAAHDREAPLAPQKVGSTHVVTTGYDGKWVGRVNLEVDGEGRVLSTSYAEAMLNDAYDDDPDLTAHYEAYLEELKTKAEEIVQSIPQEDPVVGGSAYVNDNQCYICHAAQKDHWTGTEHATAFTTLVNTNHDYDPSCFPCHTVGFGYNGGFTLPEYTPLLKHVGCQACHGAGAEHVVDQTLGWTTPAADRCTNCHTPERSPSFDPDLYLPIVTH